MVSFDPFSTTYVDTAVTGDRLLVGLNTGSLRIYRVNEFIDEAQAHNGTHPLDDRPSPQPKNNAVDLLREQEKFSKYKIEQLAIVKEANILVALSNNLVTIYDLQTFELQETLLKTKGASTFAVTSNIVKDPHAGVPSIVSRLAVAIKRRLLLWSWHDSELSSEISELALVTGIKTLTWMTGTRLIAGLASSYVLVNVETSEVTNIVGPGSIGGAPGQDGGRLGGVGVAGIGYMGLGGTAPKPLATRLSEGEYLLSKDINSFFIDVDGHSLGRRQVPWAVAPDAVGYSYPYMLSLHAIRGTLEVRNPESLSLLQTIPLVGASQLHVPQPNISLAHAGKGFLVLSDRCIWRMGALDYDSQIDALVGRGRLDEAISLIEMLEDALLKDKQGRLRDIRMLKAQNLFDQRRYRDSLDLFTEVSAPPERVIRLFPPIIAGHTSILVKEGGKQVQTDGDSISQTAENNSKLQQDANVTEQPSTTENNKSTQHTSEQDTDEVSIAGSSKHKRSTSESMEVAVPLGRQASYFILDRLMGQAEGKDLKAATAELRAFLVSTRTKLQRYLNPDGSLKDEQQVTPGGSSEAMKSDVDFWVSTQSFTEDRAQQLLDVAKLVDTTLFRAYMYASPSLAGPLFRIDNFCDPDVVNEKLLETSRYNDLVDFFYGKKLHHQALALLKRFGDRDEEDEAAPQLFGPRRTVAYLQNLPPEMIDLILDFARWPLRRNRELGMEVFIADTENAETLSRVRVLDFLQDIDRKLAVQYVEHIINELNDPTPLFHQRLADIYIQGLKTDEFESEEQRRLWKDKALEFLRNSEIYQAYKVLKQLPPNGQSC